MTINTLKTVCMVFAPNRRNMIISTNFPLFHIEGVAIQYVSKFKYLGHIIVSDNSDNDDIQREICNMFIRTNILIRRFHSCSHNVKVLLFKSYCVCLYDTYLRNYFKISAINKLRSCYHKCIKICLGSSVVTI